MSAGLESDERKFIAGMVIAVPFSIILWAVIIATIHYA